VKYSQGDLMEATMNATLDLLDMLHEECKAELTGLTQEQLDWRPGRGSNSLAVLAVHIAGAEKYWVTECIMGAPSGRDRPGEFATSGLDKRELSDVLDDALGYLRSSLASLPDSDLSEPRVHPRDGRLVTIAWALGHILQHTALHLGHMQMTRHWLLSEVDS
jgi:uncharacterized damage-inducible protein DinB